MTKSMSNQRDGKRPLRHINQARHAMPRPAAQLSHRGICCTKGTSAAIAAANSHQLWASVSGGACGLGGCWGRRLNMASAMQGQRLQAGMQMLAAAGGCNALAAQVQAVAEAFGMGIKYPARQYGQFFFKRGAGRMG